jgi:hypothetical protein
VCRGSGFEGLVTLAIMGDVGGAVCDLGGGVIESGRSTVTVGSVDASGGDGVDREESVFG